MLTFRNVWKLIPLPFLLAALGTVALLYWPGLGGPFLLDDFQNIAPTTVDDLNLDSLLDVASNNQSGLLGRPIPVFTLALDNNLYGGDPWPYKYSNLMTHLLTALLLFWLGGRLLREVLPDDRTATRWAVAGLAATLWAAHPLQVSTVLYIVQRMTLYSALFTAAALLGYTIGRQRMLDGRRFGATIAFVTVTAGTMCALLSKENGALVPLYLVLLECIVFRFRIRSHEQKWALGAFHGVMTVLPIVAGVAYLIRRGDSLMTGYLDRDFDVWDRLMTQAHALWMYLGQILMPKVSGMSLYHDAFPVTRELDLATIACIGGLLALVIAAIILRRKAPLVALAIGWFFVSHTIESTFLPLELVFEHRNYLALYGLMLLIAYLLAWLGRKAGRKTATAAMTTLVLGMLFFQTGLRAHTWGDDVRLHKVEHIEQPESLRILTHLAGLMREQGQYVAAVGYFEQAEKLAPDMPAFPLEILYTLCPVGEFPPGVLEKANQAVIGGSLNAHALSVLDVISRAMLENNCPSLSDEDFFKLARAATLESSEATKRFREYELKTILARSLVFLKDYELAGKAYLDAYHAPRGNLYPLFEKAAVEVSVGLLDEAEETAAMIAAVEDKSRYEASQLEDLRARLDAAKARNAARDKGPE